MTQCVEQLHLGILHGKRVTGGFDGGDISSDPNCRRPITEVAEIFAQVGDLPIDLECTAEEIYEHAAALRRGRAILSVELEDRHEAGELVTFVRRLCAGA